MWQNILLNYEETLKGFLTKSEIKKLAQRIERIGCKIAPIRPETGNTETIQRWELPIDSPHYATEEECVKICDTLMRDLLGALNIRSFKSREVLSCFLKAELSIETIKEAISTTSRLGSLELPIDYKIPLNKGGRHVADNLFWFAPHLAVNHLRAWVDNSLVVTKIQVKAYLTDRRQTGDFQTNREMRWETHPDSPQFASRLECTRIEMKLLAQIATFSAAPVVPAEAEGSMDEILGTHFQKEGFRCPISGKKIQFSEFIERVSNPIHGRSGYQVGHLNPLATQGGHVATNTSWITDLGNRVQGDSAIDAIIKDIFYMASFHKNRLGITWDEVESAAKQTES